MSSRLEPRSPRGPPAAIPWQFGVRAVAVVTGFVLLEVVDVHGLVFYVAWGLIGLALVSEAAATLVYWRRSRGAERSGGVR